MKAEDEMSIDAIQQPSLEVTKTADTQTFTAVGDVIVYTITVRNSGNVSLTGVVLTDALTGLNESIEILAPGESREFISTYTITQEDVDAGSVSNVATATASGPEGDELASDASVMVIASEQGCCDSFNIKDPANIFLAILVLLTVIILSIFLGTGSIVPTK